MMRNALMPRMTVSDWVKQSCCCTETVVDSPAQSMLVVGPLGCALFYEDCVPEQWGALTPVFTEGCHASARAGLRQG